MFYYYNFFLSSLLVCQLFSLTVCHGNFMLLELEGGYISEHLIGLIRGLMLQAVWIAFSFRVGEVMFSV